MTLRPAFKYFGNKRRVTSIVWSRLDAKSKYYYEPFAGSLAMLLGRPSVHGVEVANDISGLVVNFFRACRDNEEKVLKHADTFKSHADLVAKLLHVFTIENELNSRLMADKDYCDHEAAGCWMYGINYSIRGSILKQKGPWVKGEEGKLVKASGGEGATKGKPIISQRRIFDKDYFKALKRRLEKVTIYCGDWRTIIPPSFVDDTAIFLDPPYTVVGRDQNLYKGDVRGETDKVHEECMQWAIDTANKSKARIAYAGYDDMGFPRDWECVAWDTKSTINNSNKKTKETASNTKRERLYFSPSCFKHRFRNG